MLTFKKIILALFIIFGCVHPCEAQYLEDDVKDNENPAYLEDETAKSEELFNELFSDYPETERDITKVKNFDDSLDEVAGVIKKTNPNITNPIQREQEKNTPINGDLQIGITRNSFGISKNALGKPACFFSVTMKSNLNKDIRIIGLYLVYPHRTFAFAFKDIKAGKSQEHRIKTSGDICYNLTGVPDINISKCKIYGVSGSECVKRMKWSEDIEASEESEENSRIF